ncbi:MAG TPA: DUF3224 domain-containing protein [Candidatus Limnocylindrales bacterium]|nr:DUF3224 domain-containing protein [Candidatus Limnocylindrales bacterium]
MNETTTTATGTFSVDSWKDEPVADPDESWATDPSRKVGWVQLAKTFHGDLEGHSTVDMLSVMAGGAPAGYVAIERVTGTLGGHIGSFILQHAATADGDDQRLRIEVVPRTGAGELAGLSGELEIIRADDGSHSYAFHYRLEGQ